MATTPAAARRPGEPSQWLSAEEEATWRAFAGAMVKLPWALECQLQRDAGLSFTEYHVLARLSEDAEHTLRMSTLAEFTNASLSRLSHLVKRLEGRGFVRREPDPTDGRFTNAILTKSGHRKLVSTAPSHVEAVRALVIDALSARELKQLRVISERLHTRLDARGATKPQ